MVEEMVKRADKRLNKAADSQITMQGQSTEEAEARGVEGSTDQLENLSRPQGDQITQKEKETTHESDSDDSFKEIPNPMRDISGTAAKYKAILSTVPAIVEPEAVTVTRATKPADPGEEIAVIPAPPSKTIKQEVWDKATEAFEKGDKVTSDFFLKVYGQMGSSLTPDKPDILRSSSCDAVNPALNIAKRPSDKTSIVFIKGSLPKHFDVGFTPYFDKNIREFRGPIPLTIFDKNWQRDAIQWYTNRRSKGDEKDGNYVGYEYPNEWSQSFSKWTTNHCNFYITFRDLYGYPEFAEWILLHKENVDKIVGEEGFMTAFRYDMIVRQNAFSYQVTTDTGAISAVDISMYRNDVKREAWRITLTLGENDETDNPYAIGGEKFGYNPNTGKPRVKAQKSGEDQSRHDSNSGRGRGGYCG